ncbi:MAG: pilus assembly protein [Sphingomonas sp.]|nr:pilus assembly protein [Sphingomonas sp.]
MIRSLIKCERGNSFIEMAFAVPLLVALLVGMVDISRAVSEKLQVVQVAQRTIERVQRSGFDPSDAETLELEAEAAAGDGAVATVSAWLECGSSTTKLSWTSNCSEGEAYARLVAISISTTFTPMFGTEYFPGANDDGTFTFDGTAGVRVR